MIECKLGHGERWGLRLGRQTKVTSRGSLSTKSGGLDFIKKAWRIHCRDIRTEVVSPYLCVRKHLLGSTEEYGLEGSRDHLEISCSNVGFRNAFVPINDAQVHEAAFKRLRKRVKYLSIRR